MKQLRQYKESDLFFHDVECVRMSKDWSSLPQNFKDAWIYKSRNFNEINKKTGKETTPEEYYMDKAALYAPFSKIVCISAGRLSTAEGKTTLLSKTYVGDEKTILKNFADDLTKFTNARKDARLVGFNIVGFDDPLLAKRMLVNDITIPTILDTGDDKPWTLPFVDLSKIWQGNSFYPDSLAAVSAAMGLPSSKTTMNGSEVSDAFYRGEIDKISKYCLDDLLCTVNLYRRFLQKSLVVLQP